MIGSIEYLGTTTGSITTSKVNQCPNDVDTWKMAVEGGKWVNAGNNVQITCVGQDRITNTNENIKQFNQFSKLPFMQALSSRNHQEVNSRENHGN